MCHRCGKRYGSYSPASPQNEGPGVEHSTAVLLHQEAAMGLINCLISYVTPILYRIHCNYFKRVLLLHNTKDVELNTAQLFFRTKKWHWDIALLAACIRKNCLIIISV